MNTIQLSGKFLLAFILIFGITACQQNPDEIPQFIEPVTYQTSIDEMPELGPFIGKFLGTSKKNTENLPEVNGGNNYSNLTDKIDFDYILARMDSSGQTYMSMSIANDDPKVIQNLVVGKDANQNLLTPMIFTYSMSDDFYEIYMETGSLAGFSGQFERVNLSPYAYEQNESAANISQYRSSTSTDCPDGTSMEPNTNDNRTTSSSKTNQEGTSGGIGSSACTYELQIIGEICTDTYNGRGDIVASDCSPRWGNVMVCPDDENEFNSSDDPCDNPNSGEVPVVTEIEAVAGDKPLLEFDSVCQGFIGSWNYSSTQEVAGYITIDNRVILIDVLGSERGETAGTYQYDGVSYFSYPESQGPTVLEYAGTIKSAGYYHIPVRASFHTHTPCRSDGTDGTSHRVGKNDRKRASQDANINHYAIGCNSIAEFSATSVNFFNKSTGSLNIICSNY